MEKIELFYRSNNMEMMKDRFYRYVVIVYITMFAFCPDSYAAASTSTGLASGHKAGDIVVDTIIQRLSFDRKDLFVGIISDAQFAEEDKLLSPGHFGCVMKGPRHFLSAMKYFKQKGADMIVMNGDMVNGGHESAYNTYNMLLDEVYGKERMDMPPFIYPMGNHEYYCPDSENTFKRLTGLRPDTHYVLNGIHFIGVSCSDGLGGYSNERLAYLKRHLELAVMENSGNPIIVISHMPFDVDGFYGGKYCSAQSKEMYDILKKYPQVVYFCGHSHFPIFSEKSFLQKDFTMVNTGGIGYFDLDWNLSSDGKTLDADKPNEYLNPHLIGIYDQQDIYQRDAFNQGWDMYIDSQNGKIVLQRMDYTLKRPFGKPIVLENLYRKNFSRTLNKLYQQAKSPVFEKDASVSVKTGSEGSVEISFDAAAGDVEVQHYVMEMVYPDGEKKKVKFLSRGFYLGWDFPYKEFVIYNDCKKKGEYVLFLKAISSLGKESGIIKKHFVVR